MTGFHMSEICYVIAYISNENAEILAIMQVIT